MKFTLRPWSMDDLDDLVRNANNFNIAKFMTNQFPHPYTVDKGKSFIEFAMQGSPTHIFCIDVDGKASGGIGIHLQHDIQCKNAELGYWLGEPYWGNGIMTEAIRQMIDYGFKTFDVSRIFGRPFGNNIASQKALEKAGMKFEARFDKCFFKNGEYFDELFYSIWRKS